MIRWGTDGRVYDDTETEDDLMLIARHFYEAYQRVLPQYPRWRDLLGFERAAVLAGIKAALTATPLVVTTPPVEASAAPAAPEPTPTRFDLLEVD